ncbi:MAG: nuclear transport factor 2 family protein [Propionicimonas sp.]|uniref:nuclear transport factor 2 family protein n=1 Tax=Propionicimonas sp. TaxID=1955623 RepID=UPI003D0BBD6A
MHAAGGPELALETELFSIVRRERLARDLGDWDGMERLYWPGAVVRVTWFAGTSDEFIAMSRERAKGGSGMHTISPTRASVLGARAWVESPGQILIRPRLEGVECDLTAWCRFLCRLERRAGEWRLTSFDSIYVKDRVDPVVPSAVVDLDAELLGGARASYRHLTYLNRKSGYTVPDDLPGVDRPDLVRAVYAEADAWLAEGSALGQPAS